MVSHYSAVLNKYKKMLSMLTYEDLNNPNCKPPNVEIPKGARTLYNKNRGIE